jgi:hypothetical protein
MRLVLVHQPLGILPVSATMGSIEVLNYELARRLAHCCDVIVYSRKGPDHGRSEVHERVRCERITTRLDDELLNPFYSHPKLKGL